METWEQQRARLLELANAPLPPASMALCEFRQMESPGRLAIRAALARIDELERWCKAAGLDLHPIDPAFLGALRK